VVEVAPLRVVVEGDVVEVEAVVVGPVEVDDGTVLAPELPFPRLPVVDGVGGTVVVVVTTPTTLA
jgi:hypothetical protein